MAVTHKKAPTKGKTIVNQIIIKSPNRQTSDVGTWRNALKSADAGRTRELFNLYEDLYLDGILFDAVDKRISAVTNAELTFQDAHGEQVDVIADLIDTSAFEDLLIAIMKTRFWGRSAVEFDFNDGFRVHEIPVKHIDLDRRVILLNETDTDGISYEGDDHLLVIGKRRDFGIFLRTAPLTIYKRGGFGDYAQWLEVFGMPQRIGKYNSYDLESRKLLEDAMQRAGSAPWLVVPNETSIETVTNTGNGSSGQSYNAFRIACNEEMLITVLGQTLTTVQGERGARSLGEVHKLVEEGKNKSDMRFVQRILNTSVLQLLEKRGYPATGGKFIFPKAAEPLSVPDIIQLSSIIDIPARFIHDKYSIPLPKSGEPVAGTKRNQESSVEDDDDDPEPNKSQDPAKPKKPIKNADNLLARLRDFFVQAPVVGAFQNFTQQLKRSITGKVVLADGGVSVEINVADLFFKALKGLYNDADIPVVEPHLFEITDTALQSGIEQAFDVAGLEFGKKNQKFIDEFKYNASVFAAFKNHQQTKELVNLLIDDDGNQRSFNTFKKLALQVSKSYNENWLRTEYNTAVRAARSAVNFKQAQETKHLYPNLEYLESVAREKRPLHLSWVGTVMPMEDPWWDSHMPPSDWNCQCRAVPSDAPVTKNPPMGTGNPIFANNPGETASFINMKEHPYVKNECPYVGDCSRQDISLTDHPVRPACQICLFAKDQHIQQVAAEQQRVIDSRKTVKRWSTQHIPPGGVKINYTDRVIKSLTLTRRCVYEILHKGHNTAVSRNLSVMNLKKLFKDSVYAGWAEDEIVAGKKKHPDVDFWIYYKTKKLGYICVKKTMDRLYKPYAIISSLEYPIKEEDPTR